MARVLLLNILVATVALAARVRFESEAKVDDESTTTMAEVQHGTTTSASTLAKQTATSKFFDIALELPKMLGTEIAIFTLTALFAFAFKGTSVRRGLHKSGAGAYSIVPTVGTNTSRRTGGPDRQPSRQSDPATRGTPAVPQRHGRYRAVTYDESSGPTCGQMVDEIVAGARNRPCLRTAVWVLEQYDQLRHTLRDNDLTMLDACQYSRCTALDFYSCLVQNAVRASQCHLVERLVDDMEDQGVARSLAFYEASMKQLASQRHYRFALSMYDRLVVDGFAPSDVTCSCLVSFAAEIGEHDQAVAFFNQLSSLRVPSIRACMTILRVHAKRSDWTSALETFRLMQNRGVPIDSLALNVVLSTGVSADQLEQVEDLIAEAVSAKPPICDIVSFNTLVKGYAQRGDLTSAIQVVDRMGELSITPNAITFNTMLDRASRACQEKHLATIRDMMRKHNIMLDRPTASSSVAGKQ